MLTNELDTGFLVQKKAFIREFIKYLCLNTGMMNFAGLISMKSSFLIHLIAHKRS